MGDTWSSHLDSAWVAAAKHAQSKDEFLGVLNHFKPHLDEIRMPDHNLVEFSQADKDVARERFVVQVRRPLSVYFPLRADSLVLSLQGKEVDG
jgi:hypothetical protein